MAIDKDTPVRECTEEAKEKFDLWKTLYQPNEDKDKNFALIKRGNKILVELATAHFSRKAPGLFDRLFSTKNAKEYADEQKQMESMAKDLRALDPKGSWEEGPTRADYEDMLKRDSFRRLISTGSKDLLEMNNGYLDKGEEEKLCKDMDEQIANVGKKDEPGKEAAEEVKTDVPVVDAENKAEEISVEDKEFMQKLEEDISEEKNVSEAYEMQDDSAEITEPGI